MADWHDIKKAFEKDFKTKEQIQMETEQRLITTVSGYLASQKGVSSLHSYKPTDITTFLAETPVHEIKQLLGGEWAAMEDNALDTLIYTLTKKLKKADGLTQW